MGDAPVERNGGGRARPARLVSLVPSMTETVFALGAGDRLVGVTRFCVRPAHARERAAVVGGTKNPNVERIVSLRPDLVLANQEENRRQDVEALRSRVPVHLAFPTTVSEARADILALGAILGEEEPAARIASAIERARNALQVDRPLPFRYLYFIWRRPFMVAGPGTFIEGFLAEAGGINVAPGDRGRYPELVMTEIEATEADVLLLSSEPYPFGEGQRLELAASFPRCRVLLVDGELLSWHGVRMIEGLPYLGSLARRIGG
jgi:ABC-type Fe3+-hydroxamate transport system substrate-binding protein